MFRAYRRYFDFQGRSGRREYWLFVLWMFIGTILALILDDAFGTLPLFYLLFILGGLIPHLAVGVRRLHDVGRSGWWLLIGLIPGIGAIVLIVFFLTKSDPGVNRFGPPDGPSLTDPEPIVV